MFLTLFTLLPSIKEKNQIPEQKENKLSWSLIKPMSKLYLYDEYDEAMGKKTAVSWQDIW